jgi:hypothetical protein
MLGEVGPVALIDLEGTLGAQKGRIEPRPHVEQCRAFRPVSCSNSARHAEWEDHVSPPRRFQSDVRNALGGSASEGLRRSLRSSTTPSPQSASASGSPVHAFCSRTPHHQMDGAGQNSTIWTASDGRIRRSNRVMAGQEPYW